MKFRISQVSDLPTLIRELANGLRKLTFTDNFNGFKATDIVIPATSEKEVRNTLKFIPNTYIILSQSGNGLVTKGTTAWDSNYLYLYNNGSVSVTITILFME